MADLYPAGNGPEDGEKRRSVIGEPASFFFERSWVKCWIVSDQYALCLTVERNGLLHSVSVTLLDAADGSTGQRSWWRIVLGGKRRLSAFPAPVSVQNGNSALTFQQEGSAYRVFGCAEPFGDGQTLLFDLRLTARKASEAKISSTFPEQTRWFFHRRVTGALRAEGRAELGGEEYLFAPAHSLGLLEEGRGVFRGCPPENLAAAAGWIDGSPAGILLDGASRENVLLMDGRTWQLGPVAWDDPSSPGPADQPTASHSALDASRRSASADDRAALTFDPLAELRAPRRRFLCRGVEETQIFGRFSGIIRLTNGRTVPVRRLSGVVMRHNQG